MLILLARGIFKKFSFWEKMCYASERWKQEINRSLRRTEIAQTDRKTAYKKFIDAETEYDQTVFHSHHVNALKRIQWERGFRAGLEIARSDLKGAIDTPRWLAPYDDRFARNFIEELDLEFPNGVPSDFLNKFNKLNRNE